MDVIVIGGGASGLTAAITAKRCGNNVTIIEKNNVLGKKLLLTGNGRCNYFNERMDESFFFSNGDVSKIINQKNINKALNFFDSIGLYPRIKDGLFYPLANTSAAVQNALVKEVLNLDIKVINAEVIDIEKDKKFKIVTTNNSYECDKLILATGGFTYPKTGSNGWGYDYLVKSGHKIIPLKPGLVPLVTNENVSEWKGIRTFVNAKLYVDGKFCFEQDGEAQLTDYGISGICIMNLSRFINSNNDNRLYLNFIPSISNLKDFIEDRNSRLLNRTAIELLESLVNYKLLYFLFKKAKIDVNKKWQDFSEIEKQHLIEILTNFSLTIAGTKDENFAETTVGGLDLLEVNDNLESKKVPNLFVTGELLDIDGFCGGYNLANAWITGIVAGENND